MALHETVRGTIADNIVGDTVSPENWRSNAYSFSFQDGEREVTQESFDEAYEMAQRAWDSHLLRVKEFPFSALVRYIARSRERIGGTFEFPFHECLLSALVAVHDSMIEVANAIEQGETSSGEIPFSYSIPREFSWRFPDESRTAFCRGNILGPLGYWVGLGPEVYKTLGNTIKRFGEFIEGNESDDPESSPFSQSEMNTLVNLVCADPLTFSLFIDRLRYGMPNVSRNTHAVMKEFTLEDIRALTEQNKRDVLLEKTVSYCMKETGFTKERVKAALIHLFREEGGHEDNPVLETYLAVKRLVKDHDTVVDVGTGYGVNAWLFAEASRGRDTVHVFGIDVYHNTLVSPSMIWGKIPSGLDPKSHPLYCSLASALTQKEIRPPQFIQGSLADKGSGDEPFVSGLPFAPQSVDILVLGQVLRYFCQEHGGSITQIVDQMLKPGGHVIVVEGATLKIYQKSNS